MKLLSAVIIVIASAMALAPSGSHAAGEGEFYIDPPQSFVGVGETFEVDLVVEPPDESLAVWIVEVSFDDSVIAFQSCEELDQPPGSVFGADCELGGSPAAPVVSLGGVIFPGSGLGLTETTVLATITFEAIGSFGEFSDLEVEIVAALGPDPDAAPPDAVATDGYVEIGDAPPATPTPTPSPTPTPAPTPTPTPGPVGGTVELVAGSPPQSGPTGMHLLLGAIGFVAVVALGTYRLTLRRRS